MWHFASVTKAGNPGRCQPKPTQGPEFWCDRKNKLCQSSLTCHLSMCFAVCDLKKGALGNPDCKGVFAGAKCISQGPYAVCLKRCDPSKGDFIFLNSFEEQ